MKTLIVLAGLPGVGKSHACSILKKRLKNCYYFDSDLFAKIRLKKRGFKLSDLPKNKQNQERMKQIGNTTD